MWIGKQSKDSHFATMKEINEVKTRLNELEESTENLANYDDSDVRERIRDLRDRVEALETRNTSLQDLTPMVYTMEYRNGAGSNTEGTVFRRQLFTYGKIGIIKLDFRTE